MDWIDLRTILILGHIFGVALGAGAAFTSDSIFLTSVRNKILTKSEVRIMNLTSKMVWLGLFVLIASGIGLVLQSPEFFLGSDKFWAKMTGVAVIAINGLAFLLIHSPTFEKSVEKKFEEGVEIVKKRTWLMASGGISMSSWIYVIVLGVFNDVPFSYLEIIILYVCVLTIAVGSALLLKDKIISPDQNGIENSQRGG